MSMSCIDSVMSFRPTNFTSFHVIVFALNYTVGLSHQSHGKLLLGISKKHFHHSVISMYVASSSTFHLRANCKKEEGNSKCLAIGSLDFVMHTIVPRTKMQWFSCRPHEHNWHHRCEISDKVWNFADKSLHFCWNSLHQCAWMVLSFWRK